MCDRKKYVKEPKITLIGNYYHKIKLLEHLLPLLASGW